MSPIHTTDGWSCRATCQEKEKSQLKMLSVLGARLTPGDSRTRGLLCGLSGGGAYPPSLQGEDIARDVPPYGQGALDFGTFCSKSPGLSLSGLT